MKSDRRVFLKSQAMTAAAAAAGADWKTIWRFGGGITANAITEQSFQFGPEVRHLEVEFTGNTVQAVTVEAIASTYAV